MPTAPRKPSGLPCSVGVLLGSLDEADVEQLQQWLDSPSWSMRAIFEAVRAEGHEIGLQTIGRHRRGECRCGR